MIVLYESLYCITIFGIGGVMLRLLSTKPFFDGHVDRYLRIFEVLEFKNCTRIVNPEVCKFLFKCSPFSSL